MMHRLAACLAALAVVVLGVAACGDGGSAASAAADAKVAAAGGSAVGGSPGGSPSVGIKAFSGQGRLAFVSEGRLYVLDGSAAGKPATLHAVVTGKAPGSPAWSPDGRWLAFLVGPPSADGAVTGGALWLAGPDGQGAHQVLAQVGGFAWSPKTDDLAAVSGRRLFAVRPGRPPDPVSDPPGLTQASPAWSPDGSELAVAVVNFTAKKRFVSSAIDIVAPSGRLAVSDLGFSPADALIIDGWWPNGKGLFAWSDPQDSPSLAAGGLPLVSYPLNGKRFSLASTLPYPSFAGPGGNGVTLVTGGDRYLWNSKTIRECTVSGQCGPAMNATPAPVNLDPAAITSRWGQPLLAFVHAAAETKVGSSQQQLNAWYRTRKLWVWVGLGGNPLPVTRAGTGVAAPAWSANSQDILYVRANALWLIPMFTANGYPSAAPALPITGPVFAGDWPNLYGYTAWQSQFAWHT